MALSNILLASSAEGNVPIDQATTSPSKQSIIEEKYTFPAGDIKLCYISELLHIGCIGMEISIYKVENNQADLSSVEIIFFLPYAPNH